MSRPHNRLRTWLQVKTSSPPTPVPLEGGKSTVLRFHFSLIPPALLPSFCPLQCTSGRDKTMVSQESIPFWVVLSLGGFVHSRSEGLGRFHGLRETHRKHLVPLLWRGGRVLLWPTTPSPLPTDSLLGLLHPFSPPEHTQVAPGRRSDRDDLQDPSFVYTHSRQPRGNDSHLPALLTVEPQVDLHTPSCFPAGSGDVGTSCPAHCRERKFRGLCVNLEHLPPGLQWGVLPPTPSAPELLNPLTLDVEFLRAGLRPHLLLQDFSDAQSHTHFKIQHRLDEPVGPHWAGPRFLTSWKGGARAPGVMDYFKHK